MKTRQIFILFSFILALLIAIGGILSYKHSTLFKQWEKMEEDNSALLSLVAELRESSLLMTINARSYVMTQASRYKNDFLQVMGTRDGEKPRPLTSLVAPNKRTSLLTLLQEHGLTDATSVYFVRAKVLSDSLAKIEIDAINLVDGKVVGNDGTRTLSAEENKKKAMRLVFGFTYREKTKNVMNMIDELLGLIVSDIHYKRDDIKEKFSLLRIYMITFYITTVIVIILFFLLIAKKNNFNIHPN